MAQNTSHEKADGNGSLLYNRNRIQQVLEIEKQAQTIHEDARREADQMNLKAEQEGQALIQKAKADAEAEARQLVSKAQAQEESASITSQAQEEMKNMEVRAMSNFDRAVSFVLDRVAGKE